MTKGLKYKGGSLKGKLTAVENKLFTAQVLYILLAYCLRSGVNSRSTAVAETEPGIWEEPEAFDLQCRRGTGQIAEVCINVG